jgi:hypothetical protein
MKKPSYAATFQAFYPFYQVCVENAFLAKEAERDLKVLMRETATREMTKKEMKQSSLLQYELETSKLIAVVFGVMALENFIYLYASDALRHDFCNKYLDKLDLVSKWIVFPKLVTSKEIDPYSEAINQLHELVKVRNRLVHAKAAVYTDFEPDNIVHIGMQWEGKEKAILKCAKHAPAVIAMVIKELLAIDDRKELKQLIRNLKIMVKNVEHPARSDRD